MAAATDENVIRRSVYQNSNTLVEVLIKSKEPGRGRGRGRALAQTAPGWPAAVPVRKDGRPVALPSLPSRPRAGRRLPVWHQAPPLPPPGQQQQRQAGDAAPARGGQQGTAAVDKRAPQLPETAGKSAGDADTVPSAVGQEFQAWTRLLNRLVQDIKKRPGTNCGANLYGNTWVFKCYYVNKSRIRSNSCCKSSKWVLVILPLCILDPNTTLGCEAYSQAKNSDIVIQMPDQTMCVTVMYP